MIFYFAYGSNLHHLQMKRRCPNCRFIKKIILHNYKLTFRSKYGAADIEKKMGKKVYGALYNISKSDERRLDIYEEYPTLYKKMYFIHYGKKIMTIKKKKKTEYRYPTKKYLNTIKQGYKDCDLDFNFLKKALKLVE